MAEFAVAFDLPELVLGGGLGVAYVAGESAPSTSEWAAAVLDACASAGVTARGQRRAGSGARRRSGDHAVHGRHDQADPRRAHVRRRRWRDERQSATRALRQRLRGDAAARALAPTGRAGLGSSASTASPATSSSSRRTFPPTSPSATCSPSRSPAPTGTRWAPTTTRCRAPPSCSSRMATRGSWCAGRRTTTCCSPTSARAGERCLPRGGILAGHDTRAWSAPLGAVGVVATIVRRRRRTGRRQYRHDGTTGELRRVVPRSASPSTPSKRSGCRSRPATSRRWRRCCHGSQSWDRTLSRRRPRRSPRRSRRGSLRSR